MMSNGTRIVMHVDMDSFYASVEARENPDLVGKPVIVGADPKEGRGRGVVCTCSYEARRYGVHSAMPISRAYALCPQAVYLPPNFPLYTHVSGNVMQILHAHTSRFQQVSIDEAYLDLSGPGGYTAAEECACAIKSEIRDQERITCSIGIGPGKAVAKIASGLRKPDGLTVVAPDQVRDFLVPLPVMEIPGIGKKTGAILNQMGIISIGDLAGYDIQRLLSRFGRWGIIMHELALGNDDREVEGRDGSKSISRETTFDRDIDDMTILTQTMDDLAVELAGALVHEGVRFRTVTVRVRYTGFITHTRSRTLGRYTNDQDHIRRWGQELLSSLLDGRKIRLVGLRLSGFDTDRTRQSCLVEFSGGHR
jgi:DNA polymerase IV (archaeal DinB-like DNA polymerase)